MTAENEKNSIPLLLILKCRSHNSGFIQMSFCEPSDRRAPAFDNIQISAERIVLRVQTIFENIPHDAPTPKTSSPQMRTLVPNTEPATPPNRTINENTFRVVISIQTYQCQSICSQIVFSDIESWSANFRTPKWFGLSNRQLDSRSYRRDRGAKSSFTRPRGKAEDILNYVDLRSSASIEAPAPRIVRWHPVSTNS